MPRRTQARIHRVLDPEPIERLADYAERSGGKGLEAAREMDAAELVEAVAAAGIRGRGGAGFPTSEKWRTVLSLGGARTVVVNGAEGEPGTFKDRAILRRNPFKVLEGAAIAARAVGAERVIVAVKESFTAEQARLSRAVAEAREAGWLADLEVEVFAGPDFYLFGEETALLESIDGRPPFPRLAPPFREGIHEDGEPAPTQNEARVAHDHGPTLVNNVETMAHVALALTYGPQWFRQAGTDESPGTVVCTVTGDTMRAGVVEVEMGTSLVDVIDEAGGGLEKDRQLQAVLVGVSHPVLAGDLAGVEVSWDGMAAAGAGLGAAGFIVFDDSTDMVAVADGVARFLAVESCGQCEPCKLDGLDIHQQLSELRGTGADANTLKIIDERLETVTYGARCALAAQQSDVVGTIRRTFAEHFESRAEHDEAVEPVVIAPLVDIDEEGRAHLDESHLERQPDWHRGDRWSGVMPAADPEGTKEIVR